VGCDRLGAADHLLLSSSICARPWAAGVGARARTGWRRRVGRLWPVCRAFADTGRRTPANGPSVRVHRRTVPGTRRLTTGQPGTSPTSAARR